MKHTGLKLAKQAMSKEEIRRIRAAHLHPNITKNTYYKNPIVIRNASMQWLYDESGKKYLDLFGGIVTVGVGHCHPKVKEALINQANKIWHTTNIYLNETIHEYALELTSLLPGNLKVVYPVNSGSEANDLAIMMARAHTGNFDIIGLRNGYHGTSPSTMGLTGLSTWKQMAPTSGFHHTMCPDVYKGVWGGANCRDSVVQVDDRSCSCTTEDHCEAAEKYVKQLEEVLMYTVPQKKVAGFFIESIQGVGGVVQYPKSFMKKAFELIRQNGGVCISDEVQTGFGRTGDNMWNFTDHGVIPDIVTMAKSIGNGFPMAAVVTTLDIAKSAAGVNHFNTFGGNPMAGAVGLAVLQVIKEEKLQENAKKVGTYLLNELGKFRSEFNMVGDVRGKGLMIGIELVENKKIRKPLSLEKMNNIFEDLKEAGLLLGKGGYFGNCFRLTPPLCITKEDSYMALEKMREVFKKWKT